MQELLFATPAQEAAVRNVIELLRRGQADVPRVPSGWFRRAVAALEGGDSTGVIRAGVELRYANLQYHADSDERPWLYGLRMAFQLPVTDYQHAGVFGHTPPEHPVTATPRVLPASLRPGLRTPRRAAKSG